jgi:endonuclease YncB( thermonuclease family)
VISLTDSYTRAATVARVIDGDTVVVDLDLGFYVTVRMSCRLAGINAIELHSPGGPEAADNLRVLLPVGTAVTIQSIRPDKFAGRFDGVIYLGAGMSINGTLLATGWAAAWDGTGIAPVPPWPRVTP